MPRRGAGLLSTAVRGTDASPSAGIVVVVRILVAHCEIGYHGRATTRPDAAERILLFEEDGSLCVHAERWAR